MKSLILVINIFIISFGTFSKETMVFLIESGKRKDVGVAKEFMAGKYNILEGQENVWSLYPNISTDGKSIVYVKGKDEKNLVLIYRNLELNEEHILTEPGFILHPSFSNNDRDIIFTVLKDGKNKIGKINLENVFKNGKKNISYIDESENSFFPSTFQDGEIYVYQRNKKNKVREIVLFDTINNKKTIIGKGMSPSISKDEKYIAFTSKIDGDWDILVYDRFLKTITRVTNSKGWDLSPTFDRSGNLIFTSDRNENGVFSIFKKNLNDWKSGKGEEKLLIGKKGVSFYAPKISGKNRFHITLEESIPGEPRSSFGAITHNGKVYVVGGHKGQEHTYPPESFSNEVFVFDLEKRVWEMKAPRINSAHGFQLAAYGGYIYAFGGFAYEASNYPKWKSLNVVERYDIENDKWEVISEMPRRRSSNVVIRDDEKIYLIGGWDSTPKFDGDIDGKFHNEIDVFNLKDYSWKVLDKRLPKKRRAFSAFLKEGKVYLAGGISEGGSHFSLLNNFTELDLKSMSFKNLPPLPFATFAPATSIIKNSAYIFGGMYKIGKWEYEYIPHIYEYSFKKKTWEHIGRYLHESKGFSQIVDLKECLGILGGHSYRGGKDSPLVTVEKFCER